MVEKACSASIMGRNLRFAKNQLSALEVFNFFMLSETRRKRQNYFKEFKKCSETNRKRLWQWWWVSKPSKVGRRRDTSCRGNESGEGGCFWARHHRGPIYFMGRGRQRGNAPTHTQTSARERENCCANDAFVELVSNSIPNTNCILCFTESNLLDLLNCVTPTDSAACFGMSSAFSIFP